MDGPRQSAEHVLDQAVIWIGLYINELEDLALASGEADALTFAYLDGELSAARAIHLALQTRSYLLDLASGDSFTIQ